VTPAVSILLPTYNGEAYLAEQLDSILGQSFADFELLIVDDGSTDGTPGLALAYAGRDPRITILPATGNEGQKFRLLQLVRAARAPLIAISDQDDIWDRDKIARLAAALGDFGLAFGRSEIIDAGGKPANRRLIEMFGPTPRPGDRLRLLFTPQVSGHATLVRRDCVTDAAFLRYQPFDWLIALDALFSRGMVYVDDAIVHHRLHGGNQMNGPLARKARRLDPERIYQELQSTRRRRLAFVERLEHLGHSPVIEVELRKRLFRLGELCHGAWFEPGVSRPFANPKLRKTILDVLRPLAGSEEDWAVAIDNVTGLTQAQFHPRALYQSSMRLFWY
jgi:glycosyltransferase involved in cell wall biosynthesis